MSTSKPQPAAESNSIYHDTLLLIRPLQTLLAGFNHRNKNQHRVATWWASFNMLRRHVTKWADDLDQQAKARPKKRKRTTTTNQGGDGSSGPAEVRALWLRDVLMPKCYLTFSQLAADNQFAPLGLVLTGALAQLYSACVRFVGEAPTETEEVAARPEAAAAIPEATSTSSPATTTGKGNKATRDTTVPPLASSSSSSAAVPIRQVPPRIDDDDVGQVISRDSVHAGDAPTKEERADKVKRRKKVAVLTIEEDADDVGGDVMAASTEKKRRKGAATVQPKAKDGERLPGEKEKKKKKKSKKGDEFDSLFSSLF
ncbi:hypothetical protein PG997_004356 [Apiospora hydei]|uniref:RNase MRP protein 1 RNA binding domain-containing protein n=1 Tax=Apiospora hydei TaxID=1337664 RepID=A0ABR1X1Z6_9PEZI